jgi:hypothetical protein
MHVVLEIYDNIYHGPETVAIFNLHHFVYCSLHGNRCRLNEKETSFMSARKFTPVYAEISIIILSKY